jgi:hypothetical protein
MENSLERLRHGNVRASILQKGKDVSCSISSTMENICGEY